MTPNLTNMTKIATLQALIESSMPEELKKNAMGPAKNLHGNLNLHISLQY